MMGLCGCEMSTVMDFFIYLLLADQKKLRQIFLTDASVALAWICPWVWQRCHCLVFQQFSWISNDESESFCLAVAVAVAVALAVVVVVAVVVAVTVAVVVAVAVVHLDFKVRLISLSLGHDLNHIHRPVVYMLMRMKAGIVVRTNWLRIKYMRWYRFS